jgi:phage shock protein A
MSFLRHHYKKIVALEKTVANHQTDLDAMRDNQEDLLGRIRELESRIDNIVGSQEPANEDHHPCQSTQDQSKFKTQPTGTRVDCQNIQDE